VARNEAFLKTDGRLVYPWRTIDAQGENLDVAIRSRRNRRAERKFMREIQKKHAFVSGRLVADDGRAIGPGIHI
jgi:putative transposase